MARIDFFWRTYRTALGVALLFSSLSAAQSVTFTDIAASAGVNSGGKSNGVAFGDYNGDGFVDILICRSMGSAALLFKNNGDVTFTDATQEAGLAGLVDMAMPLWADFDNDGDLDLFVISFSRGNSLFENNGDGTFTDISAAAGVAAASNGVAAACADVDNDGFLDIYIANFREENILYRNNGNMTFTDITQQSRTLDQGYAMGITFCDYDNDGDQDLLLAHDGDAGNILYQNDGTGVFTDVASAANVKFASMGMGVAFGDYNNDGWFDLYITVLGPNPLYRNEGTGRFTRMPVEPQYADDIGMGWGTTWFDYDNDGFLDLYVANQSDFSPKMPNVLYHNNGDGTFSIPDGSAGTGSMRPSFGSACADINNDGWLDLFVTNDRQPDELFLNSGGAGNWLKVKLVGTRSNRDAVGARITVQAGELRCYREINAGGGFISQNSHVQHFGLGERASIDSLIVHWPGGGVERFGNLAANQRVTITENEGLVTRVGNADRAGEMPQGFELQQNYPNPFNPSTRIRFAVAGRTPQHIELAVYRVSGQRVAVLVERAVPPGAYTVEWDGRDAAGRRVASGVYVLRMSGPGYRATRKMVFLQ